MRGTIYYQTSLLAKVIFKEGALKVERIDPTHDSYLCVASFSTMESYRRIWNNLGKYLREVWEIKDFEKLEEKHVVDYLEEKLLSGISLQYAEKISAAIGKLEVALTRFSKDYSNKNTTYSFIGKSKGIARDKKSNKLVSNYHNRAYSDPEKIIDNLQNEAFKLAAKIQLEGGARFKGIRKVTKEQLKGHILDKVTNTKKGVLETKEKGGRTGDVYIEVDTYAALTMHILVLGSLKINYGKYAEAIREACAIENIEACGCHGFRWNFSKRRMREYQSAGYTYDEALQKVSKEMKHNRKEITEHYLF